MQSITLAVTMEAFGGDGGWIHGVIVNDVGRGVKH
jgi:hypothetical protein